MSEVDSIFLKLKKIITELADGKTSKSLAISELCFILMNVNTDAKPSGLINSFKNNIYLSVLNQIMKVLTIVTVVFLPLMLMVGIYGMNFENMPELHWQYGYFAVLGVMLIVVIVSISILKFKKWW